jgi:hypothetical protein
MSDRIEQEITLLLTSYQELDWRADVRWARIPSYRLPDGVWKQTGEIQLAFQLPEQLPGQAPYGFWVHPGLELLSGGTVQNYTYPTNTPFGDGWGQFSWQPENWQPAADVAAGSNMLGFVRSFAERLRQGA